MSEVKNSHWLNKFIIREYPDSKRFRMRYTPEKGVYKGKEMRYNDTNREEVKKKIEAFREELIKKLSM